ncbi:hypothetical protein [Albimonas pacifica]|uniref:VPLPA-CTERM protein sorting domain-containing protein n=1 Tax=Albimonas pacifica TaxID=1114924 RepID=A0A1I3C4U3_9RHOB|nr:hypothetical protein [Albimonas pacifica]SFH69189.1 VPLPA-CTERM protein sorting domain-containing protein [Albimonas pacifica]
MSTRRARPIVLFACLPLALGAGAVLAAQQDLAQQDLSERRAASHEAAPGAAETEESLMAWPCLETPGCAVGPDPASGSAPASSVAAMVVSEPVEATAIPLPAALGLMGAGLTVLGLIVRRRRPD